MKPRLSSTHTLHPRWAAHSEHLFHCEAKKIALPTSLTEKNYCYFYSIARYYVQYLTPELSRTLTDHDLLLKSSEKYKSQP